MSRIAGDEMPEDKPQPPFLLAINGVYEHAEHGVVMVKDVLGGVASVQPVMTADRLAVPITELTGPTHLPCPYCGEMKQVRTDGLAIDLGEHIERAHPLSPTVRQIKNAST